MSLKWWICAALLAIAVGMWFWRERRKRKEDAPQSIVLLLQQPQSLDVHLLAEVLSKETGRSVRPVDVAADSKEDDDGGRPVGDMVAGASPHFIAQVAGTAFAIHNISAPYVNDPISASEALPELRLRKAVRDHKAWLSMDIVHPQAATTEAYRVVAKLLAHFIDSDCLALYYPPLGQFAPCVPDQTIEKLKSDDPVKAVFREITEVPVIPIDDDPRLRAAEDEARRRFSEFASAFDKKDGTGFSIKTRITSHGNSEHIWVEVDRISDGKIEGRLGNDPVDLGDLKIGSKVEVEISQLKDWVFLRNQAPVGLFTVPVIQQMEHERSAKK